MQKVQRQKPALEETRNRKVTICFSFTLFSKISKEAPPLVLLGQKPPFRLSNLSDLSMLFILGFP